jgi:hypothetical protein
MPRKDNRYTEWKRLHGAKALFSTPRLAKPPFVY